MTDNNINTAWQPYADETGGESGKYSVGSTEHQILENRLARDGNILCDLSQHYGLIVIAGDDAVDFMQGQFTNDVNQVDEHNAQLNALCNNKGRMIANFILFKYQQNYFISLHHTLVKPVIEHLQQYIVRAQVAIQEVSDQLIHIGIAGEHAANRLAALLQDSTATMLNKNKNAVSTSEDYIVVNDISTTSGNTPPRYHVFAQTQKAQTCWQAVNEVANTVHFAAWEYLNIQAGIPVLCAHTSELFVPQMANLELLGGVSFHKGCYTGQEIVARMHYLGKLKRRMYRIHIDTDSNTPPRPGDKIFTENASAGQNSGIIMDAEINPESGFDALAVLQIADIKLKLQLNNPAGPVISVEDLPGSFEMETRETLDKS